MCMFQNYLFSRAHISLYYAILCFCAIFTVNVKASCGGYYNLDAGEIQYINLGSYGAYANCIWIIQVPVKYYVQMQLTFRGRGSGGACEDYLTVKDGSDDSSELLPETCGNLTDQLYNSTDRWMWVQFKADGIDHTASVVARLSTLAGNPSKDTLNPQRNCNSYEFECSNKVCVPSSYRCDKFNDCGCESDCDEQGCESLGFATTTWISFSVGIGLGVFLIIFFGTFIYERRRRFLALQQERMERLGQTPDKSSKAKKNAKGKEAKKDKKKKKEQNGKKKDVYWVN